MSAARELRSAAGLVVANCIGAGVFTTSGFALAALGTPERVLWAWVLGGGLALCGALTYAGLAQRFPESGGECALLARAVGPRAGFAAGWVSLLAGFTAPLAASALAFEIWLPLALPLPEGVLAALLIAAVAATQIVRPAFGLGLQDAAVGLKLAALLGFVVVGALWLPAERPAPPPVAFDVGAFGETLIWVSFAYSGWNAAVYIAGELSAPRRTLAPALTLGTLAVIALYLGLNAVFVYAAPVSELAGKADIGAHAARALGGAPLERVLGALVSLALLTSVQGLSWAGARVWVRMAEDGALPGALRAPGTALAVQAAAAIGVVASAGLRGLLGYIGFTLGLCAAATAAAALRQRWRDGAEAVPIAGYPVTPLLFILGTSAASAFLVWREPLQALWGAASLGIGALLWSLRSPRAAETESP